MPVELGYIRVGTTNNLLKKLSKAGEVVILESEARILVDTISPHARTFFTPEIETGTSAEVTLRRSRNVQTPSIERLYRVVRTNTMRFVNAD